jgi:hypothetical protein
MVARDPSTGKLVTTDKFDAFCKAATPGQQFIVTCASLQANRQANEAEDH